MGPLNRYAPFAVLLVLLVIVQAALIALDCRQTPARVAGQFARKYHYLDPGMQKYLCQELAQSDAVDSYLHARRFEAQQRGLPANYLRHMFTHLQVAVVSQDDAGAQLHLEGSTRVAINPAFMLIGKIFRLADQYPVEATLDLVKEEDGWKVCGAPFGLQAAE